MRAAHAPNDLPSWAENAPHAPPGAVALYSHYSDRVAALRFIYRKAFTDLLSVDDEWVGLFRREHLLGEGRFLGELYGLWLADTLGVRDETVIEALTVGSVLGRVAAILDDYLQDTPSISDGKRETVRTAAMKYREACYRHLVRASGTDRLCHYARRFERLESLTWRREHARHIRTNGEYAAHDMRCMGLKTSICFLPLAAACLAAGRQESFGHLATFVAYRNVAVQIRDDLSDWQHDLRAGNVTLPLWMCAITTEGQYSDRHVQSCLYHGRVAESLLTLSDSYLAKAGPSRTGLFGTPLERYREQLVETNGRFRSALLELYQRWPPAGGAGAVVCDELRWPLVGRALIRLPMPKIDEQLAVEFSLLLASIHPGPQKS